MWIKVKPLKPGEVMPGAPGVYWDDESGRLVLHRRNEHPIPVYAAREVSAPVIVSRSIASVDFTYDRPTEIFDEARIDHIGQNGGDGEHYAHAALDVQVGGGHYKDMKIQPVEYIHANNIGFIEGGVIKYVSRWRNKNGIQDLKKARHFLDLLIELEGNAEGA